MQQPNWENLFQFKNKIMELMALAAVIKINKGQVVCHLIIKLNNLQMIMIMKHPKSLKKKLGEKVN